MLQRISLLVILMLNLLLFSCFGNKSKDGVQKAQSVHLHYASLLSISHTQQYTSVSIRNPWDTTLILHRYILVPRNQSLPTQLPEGTLLRTPLRRVVLSSAVHCALWKELGAQRSVCGVCDASYIMSPFWQQQLRQNRMANIGSSLNVDVEKLYQTHADAIFLSPFNQSSYGAVEKTSIPIIECADYMETSPLGRAEWMEFYGMLVGKEAQAKTLFNEVESSYIHLKSLAQKSKKRPSVFMDIIQSGVWYQPGAHSTMGTLLTDAGASYVFANYPQSGSVNLSFEKVFQQAHDADFWLVRYSAPQNMTYSSLAQLHDGYSHFKAWQKHQVRGCNLSRIPFFEETPFHPERVLSDFIYILHPELSNGNSLHYFTPLS